MGANGHRRTRGFSLLELVIVVVILGIIAAIAIPRMSRGSKGAADSALNGDLAAMRNAVELFIAEHDGVVPAAADIEKALTQYSDRAGTSFQATKDTTHIYGPYLRKIPPIPVGTRKGGTTIAVADAAGVGWIYTAADGAIDANVPGGEKDDTGKLYTDY